MNTLYQRTVWAVAKKVMAVGWAMQCGISLSAIDTAVAKIESIIDNGPARWLGPAGEYIYAAGCSLYNSACSKESHK